MHHYRIYRDRYQREIVELESTNTQTRTETIIIHSLRMLRLEQSQPNWCPPRGGINLLSARKGRSWVINVTVSKWLVASSSQWWLNTIEGARGSRLRNKEMSVAAINEVSSVAIISEVYRSLS
jgi:hypothetical protein